LAQTAFSALALLSVSLDNYSGTAAPMLVSTGGHFDPTRLEFLVFVLFLFLCVVPA